MRARLMTILVPAVFAAITLVPTPSAGQGVPRGERRAPHEPASAQQRDSLEQRVRLRVAHMLRTQLGLTDEQMRRLQETNTRIEAQRRALFQQERDVRGQLRAAMRAQDTTRGAEVSGLLERMIQVQRQRVDLLESEQKELATFLTPMQRARYYGMEEQIRRRVMEMRDNDRERGPAGRPGQGAAPTRAKRSPTTGLPPA